MTTLSPEAMIGLIALFVACIPGLWYIANQTRRWRRRRLSPSLPLAENSRAESPETNLLPMAPDIVADPPSSVAPVTSHAPSISRRTGNPPQPYPFDPLHTLLQRNYNAPRGMSSVQVEAGFVYYSGTFIPDHSSDSSLPLMADEPSSFSHGEEQYSR
ncbi:hypothetical protein BDW59DRAFT_153466 [Aspergillus cavernicola]|uniref:Uncharacterized protein n=1 Tax=Aspergillus cavernicola TaxID=176166 RepID=A0ABR4HKP2_9EURO